MSNEPIRKSDIVHIALLAVCTVASLVAGFFLHGLASKTFLMPIVGTASYFLLIKLGAKDPFITCDYIQSGETALGSLIMIAAVLCGMAGTIVLPLAVYISFLIYGAYVKNVIAPEKTDAAANGAAVVAVFGAILAILHTPGAGISSDSACMIFLGYFPSAQSGFATPAAAAVSALIVYCLIVVFRYELSSYSLGHGYYTGSFWGRMGAAGAFIIGRSLLTAVAFLFAGWTCGIGISVHRLYKGITADIQSLLSMICFQQIIIICALRAGPWYAAVMCLCISYALFLLYNNRKVYIYDRNQRP